VRSRVRSESRKTGWTPPGCRCGAASSWWCGGTPGTLCCSVACLLLAPPTGVCLLRASPIRVSLPKTRGMSTLLEDESAAAETSGATVPATRLLKSDQKGQTRQRPAHTQHLTAAAVGHPPQRLTHGVTPPPLTTSRPPILDKLHGCVGLLHWRQGTCHERDGSRTRWISSGSHTAAAWHRLHRSGCISRFTAHDSPSAGVCA